jgi:hypothetical protein
MRHWGTLVQWARRFQSRQHPGIHILPRNQPAAHRNLLGKMRRYRLARKLELRRNILSLRTSQLLFGRSSRVRTLPRMNLEMSRKCNFQ